MTDSTASRPDFTEHAAEIVGAYVAHNSIPAGEIPNLIRSVYETLSDLGKPAPAPAESEKLTPAVPIKKSVTDDYIVSLEDGRKFKSLKRYLATSHNMTPDEYRAKWGLPSDYPMVAPAYAAKRSELARSIGLGRKAAAMLAPAPELEAAKPASKRGRAKKAA